MAQTEPLVGGEALKPLQPVEFSRVVIDDPFWSPRIEVNRERTIPHEYQQCKETGRIDAFRLDWKPGKEPKPHYFWDSDVAKWVEAASYTLATHPDPQLEALLDEVVELIAQAQQPDGYLNVYFTTVAPDKRWHNLGMWHELYCAGHLIEAAVAHYQATGKRRLLDVACRYADYIDSVFGPEPGKRDGCPGHQEIELALVRLYRLTGNERYLKLARFFLDQRGQKPSFFERELERLSPEDGATNRRFFIVDGRFDSSYSQDHLPVREQNEVVGHAVRAMYMYCGMADVGVETGDESLIQACRRLWDNLTLRRMYITGGIGSTRANEGFTGDYDLPNDTAYAETCAAVGLVFWAHRMLQIDKDAKYTDVLERALYNGVISGISLDGQRFFYENPLESRGDHHRQEWFGCACCPPNIARLLASLGGYIYSQSENSAYVHLFISSSTSLSLESTELELKQTTEYPWKEDVEIDVNPAKPAVFDVYIRIPGWCRAPQVRVNGERHNLETSLVKGYVRIRREWRAGDQIHLHFPMPVETVEAHPAVRYNAGCVALQRGPIVYAIEQVDHGIPLHTVVLPRETQFRTKLNPDLLGGVVTIHADAYAIDASDWDGALYRFAPSRLRPIELTAIPYYAWDHREPGEMRVWIRRWS